MKSNDSTIKYPPSSLRERIHKSTERTQKLGKLISEYLDLEAEIEHEMEDEDVEDIENFDYEEDLSPTQEFEAIPPIKKQALTKDEQLTHKVIAQLKKENEDFLQNKNEAKFDEDAKE